MKKILSIALVALLVASTAFAGFSGKATLSLGYDTTSKIYGLANGKATSATVELAAETAEVVGEGDIYAGIKATMQVAVKPSAEEALNIYDSTDGEGFGIWFSVKEAYVAGADWKVNILGGKGAPDYAVSAIDGEYQENVEDAFGVAYDDSWVAKTYKVSAWNGAGITASFKDWTVAGGFKGKVDDYLAFNAFIETPAIAFEGGSVKAAALVARDGHKTDDGVYDALDKTNVAVSAKADYSADAFSAAVAADFGFENVAEDAVFNFDAAANVAYSPVAVDVYFSRVSEVNYLSAQVSGAYKGISGDIYAQDILAEDKNVKIGADAEFALDAVTVGAGFSMTTESKEMEVSGNVKYAAEMFTAKAGAVYGTQIDVEDTAYFYATASIESSAIINGATISLSYGADSNGNDMNFLEDQNIAKNFGAVTAKCVIAF